MQGLGEIPAMAQRTTREDVVRAIRTHYVLGCLSDLHRSEDMRGRFRGTWTEGCYVFDDGDGHRLCVRWDSPAMVGLVFDKDSSRNESAGEDPIPPENYQPLRHLKSGLPASCLPDWLDGLAWQAAEELEGLVTAGFWTASGVIVPCSGKPVDTHGWFQLLDDDPTFAAEGLDEEQQALARSLGASKALRELSEAELEVALRGPTPPTAERIATVRDALACAEIRWL